MKLKLSFKNTIRNHKKSGFTLVETLVAITILMIAVAGPLVIASKGLTAALYSKDQMIASMLAQESMEMIKNKRDIGWDENNWLKYFINETCTTSNFCDWSPLNSTFVQGGTNPFPIYFNDNGYTNDSSGGEKTKTIFSRYFYFDVVSKNDPAAPDATDDNQKIVHVIVQWKEGTIPFEVELISLLTNQKR